MKKVLAIGVVALAVVLAGSFSRAAAEKAEGKKELRHIVMFKFADSAGEAGTKEIVDALVALKDKIDLIKGLEWGTNVSKEKLDKGLTHIFTLTFDSQEDLDAYIVHPAHKAFVGILGDRIADVCVVDYWAQ